MTLLNLVFVFQSAQGLEQKIYLKSSDFKIEEEMKLAELFNHPDRISTAETKSLIDGFIHNKNTEGYFAAYTENFFSYFQIEDMMEWRMKNSKNLRGAYDYVTDPPDGSDPLWQSTNRKLRSGKKLSSKESKFVSNLNLSFQFLPKFEGIVFRGVAISKEILSTYQKGKVFQDPTFVSTSINPVIAQDFSKTDDPTRVSVIFIIQVKEGIPVSMLHEFHWDEKEILLKNGQKFEVIQKVDSVKSVYVYLKQL